MRTVLCTLNSSFSHANLALRYLREAIRREWPDHYLVEFQVKDDLRRVTAEVGNLRPDVLALSCYIWNITSSLALATDLKAVLPDLRIVLGGPEVGPRAQQVLEQNAAVDYVIAGEGELALPELLTAIKAGRPPHAVPGVYYRSEHGQISGTPEKLLTPEQIPCPYRPEELADLQHKLVYYESSRGCPFRCSYCLSGNDRVRLLPLERVMADLRPLLQVNIPLIKFVDRTFNCDSARALTLMKFLVVERRDSRFHFEICADLLSDELLDWLVTVPPGIFQFEIGVQSVNTATLTAIGRAMRWDKLASNVRRLRAADNIHLHLDLIAGLPYQNWEAMHYSFDQVMGLRPHMLQLGFLKVIPGTQMAKQAQEFGLQVASLPPYEVLASDWLSFSELNRLHLIEQLLESYYNSGLLRYSLPYIWQRYTTSPFEWLQELSHFWESEELHLLAHGREALFAHLESYLRDCLSGDPILQDLLTVDKARTLASFPARFHLPATTRTAWSDYLAVHLANWQPRNHKQAIRSVFPVWLQPATLDFLQQDPTHSVAVVDRNRLTVVDYIKL